jgi:hypothetical protein
MARAKPMVLDFSRCADYGHRVMFNALPHPIEVSGPTTFTIDTDGQLDHWHPRCDPRIPLIKPRAGSQLGVSLATEPIWSLLAGPGSSGGW